MGMILFCGIAISLKSFSVRVPKPGEEFDWRLVVIAKPERKELKVALV